METLKDIAVLTCNRKKKYPCGALRIRRSDYKKGNLKTSNR